MKKILMVLCLFLILPTFVIAQDDSSQKITVKKFFGENRYYYNGKVLSLKQLEALLKEVPDTQPEVQKARKYLPYMRIFSFTGGFLIGYSIGEDNENSKRNFISVGGVSAFAGLRYQILMDKHYEKAVEIYNSNKKTPEETNGNANIDAII